jgi:trehalose synthase
MSGNCNLSQSETRGLPRVKAARYCCPDLIGLEHYRGWVNEDLMEEIRELSRGLRGLRVCHINSTASGGGVAEMLSSLVPLCSTLGLCADWRLIVGDDEFFHSTKDFHNALQGAPLALTEAGKRTYLDHNRLSAKEMQGHYDLYVVHDPQPVAIRHFAASRQSKWLWRCHIDSSSPNPEAWEFVRPFVEQYDAVVFTMESFQPSDLPQHFTRFIPPAIDPLSTKNLELSEELYCRVLSELGISLRKPILLQVSRFDPWKDPLGVIRAYRLVRQEVRDIQLVLVGGMAADDPQGSEVLEALRLETGRDNDIHVLTNLGNLEVNAFQQAAYAVIQKSIKEGFGLVVSEAFWKRKPVVAGNVGGIPLQFPGGYEEFLTNNVEECARRLLTLLKQPALARTFGVDGRSKVESEFLLPRLLRDELRLFQEVLGTPENGVGAGDGADARRECALGSD